MSKITETDKTLIRLAHRFRYQADWNSFPAEKHGDFIYDFYMEQFGWNVLRTFVIDKKRMLFIVEYKRSDETMGFKRSSYSWPIVNQRFLVEGQVYFDRDKLISLWIHERRMKILRKIINKKADAILDRLWRPGGRMCQRQWGKIYSVLNNK